MGLATSIKRPLLYQEVIGELYRIIDERGIQPGEQFPSERDLIAELGVSRNVLREAFHILEQRRIITSRQGKGRFLRELPEKQLKAIEKNKQEQISKTLERCSLREAYEVRKALECSAIRMVVENATQADLAEIERTYRETLERFQTTNSTLGEFDLHRVYAQKSGNAFMEQIVDLVLAMILEMMSTTSHELLDMHQAESEQREHRKIIDALWKRDAGAAEKAMAEHIQASLDIL